MGNRIGRPEKLNDKRKSQVAGILAKHPDWSEKRIYDAVLDLWIAGLRGKYPSISETQLQDVMNEELPVYDTVGRFIRLLKEPSPEDKPWSLGVSMQQRLEPEASNDLVRMWRVSLAIDRPITVRQAKWIVYLRSLYRPAQTGYAGEVERSLELISRSWLYSVAERVWEISNASRKKKEPLDTSEIDAMFCMNNWEFTTGRELGKVNVLEFPEQILSKLAETGTSIEGPPRSINSVEQAVWKTVRAEPPKHMEMHELGIGEKGLEGEADLVCAYWLRHLSKGKLWNDLPETHWIREHWKEKGKLRKRGVFVSDSGGFPDDSMYFRQLAIRRKIQAWANTDSVRRRLLNPPITGSFIEQFVEVTKMDLPGYVTPPFNATLLERVGYAVTADEMQSWLTLHERELRFLHSGFDHVPSEVRDRFIRDEESPSDEEVLERADIEQKGIQEKRRKTIEQEFLELVHKTGGPPKPQDGHRRKRSFWTSVRDEWFERYPQLYKNRTWPPQPDDFESLYGRLITNASKEEQ